MVCLGDTLVASRPPDAQAASRTGPDTTMTRHGAPFSTRTTGSGVARLDDAASSARCAPTMMISQRSEVASATIAAPKSRARTSRDTTLTPYASPVPPARSSSLRAASSMSSRRASSGSSAGTSITVTTVIFALSSTARRHAIWSASKDSERASSGTNYAIVDDALSLDFPLGDAVETFIRREDAEWFIEEVRGDDPELAEKAAGGGA